MPTKSALSLPFLTRLDVRLRRSSSRLTAAASEDSKASPIAQPPTQDSSVASETERSPRSPCSSVSAASRGGKVKRVISSRVREGAALERPNMIAHAAANALCKALADLDNLLESTTAAAAVDGGTALNSYQDQFHGVVSLCDVVARGALLCCEGATYAGAGGIGRGGEGEGEGEEKGGEDGYTSSLETLLVYVERAKDIVAPLCSKGPLAKLSRNKKMRRDLEMLSVSVVDFATNHKPELATTEDRYVSSPFGHHPVYSLFLESRAAVPVCCFSIPLHTGTLC